MTHKNIRIPVQNIHDIMVKLGSIDNSLEFVDLNKEVIETKPLMLNIRKTTQKNLIIK